MRAARSPILHILFLLVAIALAIGGCARPDRAPPAVELRTVTRTVEVQRPCPVARPQRPAPLGTLPSDAIQLAAVLGDKLAEWSGPGGYGERADAAIARCTADR